MTARPGRRRILRIAAALALLAIFGTVTLLSAVAKEPASAFADPGVGAGGLVRDARAAGLDVQRVVSSPLAVVQGAPQPGKTLLALVGSQAGYSPQEAAGVRAFLEAGGQVLVADAFGNANTLTTPLGVTFERVRLVDPALAQGLEAQWDGRPFKLQVGQPTALRLDPALKATVLASSSASSFLDRNGDGVINAADPQGPFPVLAVVDVGTRGGRLVALADPAPLHEAPGGAADDRAWRQAVLEGLLPQGGAVAIDESRAGSPDPLVVGLAAVVATASAAPWRWVLVGLAGVLLGALALPQAKEAWGPHRFRPDRFVRRSELAALPAATIPPGASEPGQAWTRRGVTAILAGGACSLLGLAFGSTECAFLGALLLAAAGAALLTGPPRVGVRRSVPTRRVPEESPLQVRLTLWSAGGQPLEVEVRDPLPQEFRLDAGTAWFQATLGRDPLQVDYTVAPALRGPYTVGPLTVRRADPLRLRRQQAQLDLAVPIEVEPRREPINRMPFKTRVPRVTLGPHLVNRAGDGSEFHSLRNYQEGDAYRSINWKASARSKDLVVTQRVHESRTTLTLFLDARAISGAGPAASTPLAHGCRVALGLATGALQVRDRVRIVIYGDGVQEIPPGAGSRQMHDLARRLSKLRPAGATPFKDALDAVVHHLQPGTPAILVSGLEADPTAVQGLRDLRARGLLVTVIASPVATAPGPEAEAEDGGPEPAAARIDAQVAQALADLRGSGVTVFEALEDVPLDYLFRLGVLA